MASEEDDLLNALESGEYRTHASVSEVKSKLLDFINFFNSTARLSMMHANRSESEEFVYLLYTLKNSISAATADIGKAHKKIHHNLSCCDCKERININSSKDIWSSFQDHNHIEDLYYRFLNGLDLTTYPIICDKVDTVANEIEQHNENEDSGIEHGYSENFNHHYEEVPIYKSLVEDVNSFRFNFKLQFDEIVESKMYPKTLTMSIQRLDKCEYSTVQRTGQVRAVCLLCCRELMSRTKVSRAFLQEHVLGQRHVSFTKEEINRAMLRMYHETWLGIEMPYQSHQLFFIPVIPSSLQCVLCGDIVTCSYQEIKSHIEINIHKKRVKHLFESSMEHLFFLLETAIEVYGEPKEDKIKPANKNKVKKKNTDDQINGPKTPSSDPNKPPHNIIKAIVSSKTEISMLEMIPNRFRKSFDALGKLSVNCRLCKCNLKGIELLKTHIEQPTHIYSSKSPLVRYSYYCEICNEKIPDEFHWQKHFKNGPNQHQNMAESRKARVAEYECTVCSTVIFGDELSLARHLSSKARRVQNKPHLPDKVVKLLKSVEDVECESERMAEEANDSLQNNAVIIECCGRIETVLRSTYSKCKAYPFGSRVSGLGHKDSDLDVFIDIGDMYSGEQKQDTISQVQIVRKVAVLLQKNQEFSGVVTVATARTPIVRVIHEPTLIDCDLSFRHGLSVENTKFLKFCIDIQPITQPFVLLLKKWSELTNMREHMSNYAITIMAIFYLQLNGYLLSVKEIRLRNPAPSVTINGWETCIYTATLDEMKAYIKPYAFTITKLLTNFFQYYARFNYIEDVVCPLLGHVVKKDLFKGPKEHLMRDMYSYVVQLEGEEPEEFRCLSVFCVQDPFDLSHNLTKAWQSGTLKRFKELCELTYKHLVELK